MSFSRAAVIGFIVMVPAATGWSAETPALRFDHKSLSLPPLSLLEMDPRASTPGALSLPGQARRVPPVSSLQPRPGSSSRSPMPVVRPNETVDYRMTVVPPDPTVDFKLAIKDPDPATPQRKQ